MITAPDLKILLTVLGFVPEEGRTDIWVKIYANHANYKIWVDFNNEIINYGPQIILGDKTTSNFSASENFVVLECVNRLLEKGYVPQSLTLEKDYPLGHKTKGKLDILVHDENGKGYLMIECKTWGVEYERAFKKTIEDGGQILSYFQQDKDVQFLSLYTSQLLGKKIEYKSGILKIEPEYTLASNTTELFSRWNKALKLNGIFEDGIEKYHIIPKAYTLNDLSEITQEQSKKIFHQFEEILRRNVISDKPNAFNKFIALLICKIVDEKKKKTEQLEFQWLDDDTPEKLLIRLNDLYRFGMKSYLDKTITDFSDKDVDDEFNHLDVLVRDNIKKMFARMRLEKNNEFAFKEVFDHQTFLDNAIVVKELVQMLEKFKVRYNRKHDYLGAFFELLLNTSLKQEAGQFFTPVPIARFIINSIPLKEIITGKIKDRRAEDILPYAIDYACGSGHFITEIMDEIQKIINDLAGKDEYDEETERTLNSWKVDQFKWAEKHIYGIEKDYRLFKTAKVACFLNGDGLANIINADGLSSFKRGGDYKDKLTIVSKTDVRENGQFDVLVSNPPYSVSAFRNTIIDKHGAESFELFDRLTAQSSEIECLFIERTKQLLKEDGYAGIVLPSSILSNTGIYQDTREMLLKYFKIVAIAEFGSNTFMATGTNTVTLFLQRRNNYDYQRVETVIESFCQQGKDLTCNGIENAFSKYVAHVYKTISFDDYVSLIQQKPTGKLMQHELFTDYRKAFDGSATVKNLSVKPGFKSLAMAEQEAELNALFFDDTIKREKEKLLYFILAYPQQTLLIKSNPDGKNETEKAFLGYEFSNRRGSAGIKPYGAESIPEATMLYDEQNVLNPEKVNNYIYQAFLGSYTNIPEKLAPHIIQQNLVDMLSFDRVEFSKSISLSAKKKSIDWKAVWGTTNLVDLNIVAEISKGTSITKSDTVAGNIPVVAGGKEPAYFHDKFNRTGDVITVSASGANAGYVNFFTGNIFASDCNTIQSKDLNQISTKLIYYYLTQIQNEIYTFQRGQAQPHVYANDLNNIKIPLPSKEVQDQIIKEFGEIESREANLIESVSEKKSRLKIPFNTKGIKKVKLQDICNVKGGKRIPLGLSYANSKTNYPYLRVTDFKDHSIDTENLKYVSKETFDLIKNYVIGKDDIYISIAGTIGLVGIIPTELDGKPLTENAARIMIIDKNIVNKHYLLYFLSAEYGQEQIKDRIRALGTPKLSLNRINSIEIPLPSMADQQKIVSEIEVLENEIASLKSELSKMPAQKAAILKKHL